MQMQSPNVDQVNTHSIGVTGGGLVPEIKNSWRAHGWVRQEHLVTPAGMRVDAQAVGGFWQTLTIR